MEAYEVYEALVEKGYLQPWPEYLKTVAERLEATWPREWACDPKRALELCERATGKTTRRLCEVLAYAISHPTEKVGFRGRTLLLAKHQVQQMNIMAEQLGVTVKNVVPLGNKSLGENIKKIVEDVD